MNLSYWGFNQYIIQRALAAKDTREAQKGIVLAAFLKLLMPVLVVLPGIAAGILAPHLEQAGQAYPYLMTLLPPGLLGLVFAALIAAIIASMGSKINSIATIFTIDLYKPAFKRASETHLVVVGRLAAIVALVIAMLAAKPLLGNLPQAFQYIQEYTGFVTPGIVVIFVLGMFWSRATTAGAFVGAVGSVGAVLRSLEIPAADPVHEPRRLRLPDVPRSGRRRLAAAAQTRQDFDDRSGRYRLFDQPVASTSPASSSIAILIALYYTFW